MEEEWTPIELNTWYSKTICGCLEARVGGKQVHITNFSPIKDKVSYQGKKTLINWCLFPVGVKIGP